MGHLPVLKPGEVVALFGALGFSELRPRGSLKQFRHPDGRCTRVPFHAGRDHMHRVFRKVRVEMSGNEKLSPTAPTFGY